MRSGSWLPSILAIAAALAPLAIGAAARSYLDHTAPPGTARALTGADKLLRGAHFEVQGVALRGAP